MDVDPTKFIRKLRSEVKGEVFDSPKIREAFSWDESIFSVLPLVVVSPLDEKDVQAIVALAKEFHVPVTARSGGTGVAGQSIGTGIVLDFKPHFGRILDQSSSSTWVLPGVTLARLNFELFKTKKRFSPDPSSKEDCCLGGMVSTNASGPHSFAFGDTRENVLELQGVLASGETFQSSTIESRFGSLSKLMKENKALIEKSTPKVRKNSSGYALSELCKNPSNFTRFLVGSEGTLALITKIQVKVIPIPTKTWMGLFTFSSLSEALNAVPYVQSLRPVAIELVDSYLLQTMNQANPLFCKTMGIPKEGASLWVEWEDELPKDVQEEKIVFLSSLKDQAQAWELRSKASKLFHEQAEKLHRKPLRFIEDTVVPVEKLSEYVRELQQILHRHDCMGAIFGHVGEGHVHVNPQIEVTAPNLWLRIQTIMEEVFALVWKMGGSISGEHGDGWLRPRFADQQWKSLLPLVQKIKTTMDPEHLFNPGKKFTHGKIFQPPLRIRK